jgi:hypothetical protein
MRASSRRANGLGCQGQLGRGQGLLSGSCGGDAIAAEPQELGQPGGRPEGGIQDDVDPTQSNDVPSSRMSKWG